MYRALYRQYRPEVFDEVLGQDHIVRILQNQIATGSTSHAYLFCGTRGTGKTTTARLLAKGLNCLSEGRRPCGQCPNCQAIKEGSFLDVIEIDAASNRGVDDVRELRESVKYPPAAGRMKVYIIDEVHMLTTEAFNALLKTLEEPPEYVTFILATTEAGRIPVTILSRCQRYDFHRIDVDTITARLRELTGKEGVQAEERALRFIARAGDGSMRDALSLLDRCLAFYMDEELTYDKALKALGEADTTVFREMTEAVFSGNAAAAMKILGRQIADGVEIGQLVRDYIWYLRNLLVARSTSREDALEIIDASSDQMDDLLDLAQRSDPDALMRCIRILSELQNRMRYATNRRVLTEVALLQMARPEGDRNEDALMARMAQIETRLDEAAVRGLPAAAAAAPPEPAPAEEEAEVLPDAAPEDLKEICADWKHLIGGMEDGFLKNMLKREATPQYNAETLENRLYLELRGNETADRLLMNTPDNREELERYLERKTGRHVEVEMHLAAQRGPELRNVDIDGMMRSRIHMDIEESEDDDTEDEPF